MTSSSSSSTKDFFQYCGLSPINWFFLMASVLGFLKAFRTFTFIASCPEQMETLGATNYKCTPLETLLVNKTAIQGCMLAILQVFLALLPRLRSLVPHVVLTKRFWTVYAMYYWTFAFIELFGIEAREPKIDDASVSGKFQPYSIILLFGIFMPCWWLHPSDFNSNGEFQEIPVSEHIHVVVHS